MSESADNHPEQTIPVQDPYAYVFGQPVTALPQDLFIPPDALQIVLERFEGPLDLLLYLIRKQNLDVLDIPMALITEQYLSYIQMLDSDKMDLAAEYLLMAALLIEIKSRLLLPKPPQLDEDEAEDPRAELGRRLLAYEQMKLAALKLDALPLAGRDFAWVCLYFEHEVAPQLPHIDIADLKQAWLALLSRTRNHQHHQVTQELLSVREQMVFILKYLSCHGGRCRFVSLFTSRDGVRLLVVNFIALLELVHAGMIDLFQDAQFSDIEVCLLQEHLQV